MAYELTWGQLVDLQVQEDPTTTPGRSRAKHIAWALQAFIKGAIGPGGAGVWTVVRSSDGVSVADSDLWGNTYNPTKIIYGTGGAPFSWIVLQAPASMGALQICFGCNGSTPEYLFSNWRFSVAGFTGGNTTTLPAAADATTGGGITGAIAEGVAGFTHAHSGVLSTRGDFLFFTNAIGRQNVPFIASVIKMQEADPSDQWPWIFCFTNVGYSGATERIFKDAVNWYCRLGAGVVPSGTTVQLMWPYVSASSFLQTLPSSGDSQTRKHIAFPAYCGIASTTYGCIKGRLPDFKLGPMFAFGGSTLLGAAGYSASGDREHSLICGLWVPMTVSPSF